MRRLSKTILYFLVLFLIHANVACAQGQAVGGKSRLQQASELYKQSNFLAATGASAQAVASYEDLDARFGTDDDPAVLVLVAKGLINKASRLGGALNRLSDELAALDDVILRFGNRPTPVFDEHVAAALNNKIFALKRQGKFTEALLVYDQLEARFGQHPAVRVRAGVAMGLFNKAEILEDLNELAAAAAVYDEVDKRYGDESDSEIREQVLYALVYKALVWERLNKTTDKVLTYRQIYRRYGDGNVGGMVEPGVREKIAVAMLQRFQALKGNESEQDDQSYEARILVAEELERQFGKDKSTKTRQIVRTALNSVGYESIMRAKAFWADRALRKRLLASAITLLQQAKHLQQKMIDEELSNKANAQHIENSDHWYVLGNLGYALFLADHPTKSKLLTSATLKLGGKNALTAQRGDAKLFRVVPQDTRYEALLSNLWKN